MGKWPWGRAEFTAGPPELGQETQGLGTMQERASRPRWQPPLWECRSQQVCRGLFLAKNAAVGKGSQPLSGDPRRPGAPEGRRQGWGGDSCLLSLRPVGQNRDQKGPWEQLGRKARIPAPVPSQPRRRTPTRHLDKVLLLPAPACPPPHQAARGRCPPPPGPCTAQDSSRHLRSGRKSQNGVSRPGPPTGTLCKGHRQPRAKSVTSTGLSLAWRFGEPVQGWLHSVVCSAILVLGSQGDV